MHLYPGNRTIVVDETRGGVGLPTSGSHHDRVDGMVSHLLDLGLHLVFDYSEAPAPEPGSLWKLVLDGYEAFTLLDPDGVVALATDSELVDIEEWLGFVRSRQSVWLLTGTDLFDGDDVLDLDRALAAGTLVGGWALLSSRATS